MKKILRALVLFFIFFTMFGAAHAQGATTEDASAIVITMYKAFFSPFAAFRSSLNSSGMVLLWSLVTLHVIYGGVKLASGATDLYELAMDGMKLTLVSGLIFSAMLPTAWLGSMAGMGGPATLPGVIVNGMQSVIVKAATSAAAANTTKSKVAEMLAKDAAANKGDDLASASMFGQIVQSMFQNLQTLLSVPLWPDAPSKPATGWWKDIKDMVGGLSTLVGSIIGLVFWIGTIFMYLIACGLLLLELIGAVFTVTLAIAFTPLMVPWLLFKPMQFLFDAWLKSIIVGSLAFVIAVLMLSGFGAFTQSAADSISNMTPETYKSGYLMAMTFLPLFLGSFIFGLLVTKITNMAQSLVSGSGLDGISIKNLAHGMHAVGKASGGVKGGVAQIASVGGRAAGKAIGAASSAKSTYQAAGKAHSAAGGGIKGAGAAVGSVGKSAGSAISSRYQDLKERAGSAVGSAVSSESPGMRAAKAQASSQGLAPSKPQLATAAAAANTAMNGARMTGGNKMQVAKAGNDAARVMLSGASSAGKTSSKPTGGFSDSGPSLPPQKTK